MKMESTTLRIYKYMVLHGKPVGVRELQRKLKLSSPSLVSYHLNKLEKMGLVSKCPDNKYVVNRLLRVDTLAFFVKMGKIALPRFLFYSVFFTGMLLVYSLIYRPRFLTESYIVGFIVACAATAICWYETIQLLKKT